MKEQTATIDYMAEGDKALHTPNTDALASAGPARLGVATMVVQVRIEGQFVQEDEDGATEITEAGLAIVVR